MMSNDRARSGGESLAERACFWILSVFAFACALWGGGSRLDITGLVLLQPLAVICAVAFLFLTPAARLAEMRVPLLLLATLAVLLVAQLVPLPPAIWTNLPGRSGFAELAGLAGIAQPWRPISLTPDLTLATLVGLIVPFTALVGFAGLSQAGRRRVLTLLLIMIAIGALLGLAQLAGGPRSPFYLYSVTNQGSAVGLFANRNHQAALLAAAFPMLALWVSDRGSGQLLHLRPWIAASCAIALPSLLLVTGSRAGLLLALIGLGLAAAELLRGRRLDRKAARIAMGVAAGATVCIVGMTVLLSRAEALQRLMTRSIAEEGRFVDAPVLFQIMGDFFPFGTGFGSFDPIFRMYEPFERLNPSYLNHAHNDLIEIAITGGAPALLILLLFVLWWGRQTYRAYRPDRWAAAAFARLGGNIVGLLLIASLLDYPLRTPLMAMVAALACGWLTQIADARRALKPALE